jgi:hypothetical protein
MAVMTGTGGTAKWRVTCTGAVRHGCPSQPGGAFGGSETGGPGEDFAAGEPGVPGAAGVPVAVTGDVADAGGDGGPDAVGDTDDAGGDPWPGGAAPAALLPAPHEAVATAIATIVAINAVEAVLGRCIMTSVTNQPRSRRSRTGTPAPPGPWRGGISVDRRSQL